MSAERVAVDGFVVNNERTAAGEGCVVADLSLFKRHRRGTHFEYRTGHICIGDRLVTPHGGQRLVSSFFAFFFGFFIDLRLNVRGKRVRVVEVIAVGGDHRDNSARVYVHSNADSAVFYVVLLDSLRHILFADRLDRFVYGEVDVVSVLSLDILLVLERHICSARVAGGNYSAGIAREVIIVFEFNALKTLFVRAGEADNAGRELFLGVVALVVVQQLDNAVAVVILGQLFGELHDLVALIDLDLALNNYIVALLLGFFEDVLIIDAQDLRQSARGSLALLVVFEVYRRKHDLPRRRAFGEHLAL